MAGADPLSMIFNKLSIKGSLVGSCSAFSSFFRRWTDETSFLSFLFPGNQADTDEALDFAARGLIKPHITVIPFADLGKGLALLVSFQDFAPSFD